MKALSLWQPWIEGGIFRFGKRIENRDWRGCGYRGPLLLHASKSVGTQDNFEDAVDFILDAANPAPGPERIAAVKGLAVCRIGGRGRHHAEGWWAPHPDLVRGAIVGRCRVAGVVLDAQDIPSADQQKWWMGGFALVLADVERLDKPIPYKGAQGFFEVPDALLVGATWKAAA